LVVDAGEFRWAGEAILGGEWHRAIARELGPHHPDGPRDAIDDRIVRRWAAGERDIPDWVQPAMAKIAALKHAKHAAAASTMYAIAHRLRSGDLGRADMERAPDQGEARVMRR
jgi:hypothetical protein